MTTSLPPNPSIENLKKQAKTLKKAWQAGEAGALERIQEYAGSDLDFSTIEGLQLQQ